MSIDIRPLDLASDEDMRAAYDVYHRAETQDGRPWVRPSTYADFALELREPRMTEWYDGFVATLDGELAGVLRPGFFRGSNEHMAWLNIQVAPELRRRGVGSALLEHGIEHARAQDRTTVLMDTEYAFELRDTAPAAIFAKAHGFTLANVEILRTLDLPVDPALLEGLASEAAAHHGDYEIVTYAGSMPEELQPSWCDVVNRLTVDAPGGEIEWELSTVSPASYQEGTARLESIGRRRLGALAVRDGKVVAETHIVVTEGDPHAEQWSTVVAPDHRGHRLGAAVKVANLRQLQRVRPDTTAVTTQNAETNGFMVSINEALGFVPTAMIPEFQRRL